MKICKKCNQEKELDQFNLRKTTKDGYHIYCKKCKSSLDLLSYHKNKEKRLIYIKKYKIQNPSYADKSREGVKKWIKNNPNYMKEWAEKQRLNNINYRIKHNLSERLRIALKNIALKEFKTMDIIGCSIKDFKQYIENQFDKNMNWDNYGRKGWHIDHIKPCSKFDLTKKEEQQKCFHYTNLQPLWWYDNLKKSAKY